MSSNVYHGENVWLIKNNCIHQIFIEVLNYIPWWIGKLLRGCYHTKTAKRYNKLMIFELKKI
jgi:hypothetical protein